MLCLSFAACGDTTNGDNKVSQPATSPTEPVETPTEPANAPAEDVKQLSGKVTVYMPSPAGLADKIAAGFKASTGVEVEVFQGTTGEILARLEAEEANPIADVVILASWSDGLGMKASDKLMSYTPANADKIVEGWIDADSTLFGYSASAVGVIYNTTIIPELSADWGELAGELAEMAECMPHYYKITNGHGQGAETIMRAEAAFVQGRFTDAHIALESAYAQIEGNGQENMALCCDFLAQRLSRYAEVGPHRSFAERRTELLRHHNASWLNLWNAVSAYCHALSGEMEQIPEVFAEHRLASVSILAPGRPMIEMIENQVYLAQGAYAKVIGRSEGLLALCEGMHYALVALHVRLQTASPYERLGQRDANYARKGGNEQKDRRGEDDGHAPKESVLNSLEVDVPRDLLKERLMLFEHLYDDVHKAPLLLDARCMWMELVVDGWSGLPGNLPA